MSLARRTRSLARQGVKVQRRIALAQLLFWPAVLCAGAAGTAVAVVAVRRSKTRAQTPVGGGLSQGAAATNSVNVAARDGV